MNLDQAIKTTANEFVQQAALERTATPPEEPAAPQMPVDFYQQRRAARRDQPVARVKGASKKLMLDLESLLDGGLEDAYRKAVDDSESLRAEGELARADMVRQQYMEESFLPLVDALIRLNSQEEVLASQDALETLDSLAMTPGGGKSDGYTSVYVSSMYEPVAEQVFTTDAEVADGIRRINALCNRGNVKPAIAIANKLLEGISMGENRATPDDYELIQKIALRG